MSSAFVPFTNAAETICKGVIASVGVTITMGMEWLGSGHFTPTDMSALNTAIQGWLHNDLTSFQATTFEWYEITTYDLVSSSAPVVTTGITEPGVGTAFAAANQVAAVVTFLTGNRGRSFRGRNFIPGVDQNAILNTIALKVASQTALTGYYNNLPTALSGTNFQHVVLSRYAGGVARTLGVATQVTSYYARQGLKTQRRRLT